MSGNEAALGGAFRWFRFWDGRRAASGINSNEVTGNLARPFADDVKSYRHGDWDHLADGRTLYMGAPSSDARARLYEKGKQLRSQVDTNGKLLSLDWTRLEIQIRPQGEARLAAASMTPEEAWGCSQWTHSMCLCTPPHIGALREGLASRMCCGVRNGWRQ